MAAFKYKLHKKTAGRLVNTSAENTAIKTKTIAVEYYTSTKSY